MVLVAKDSHCETLEKLKARMTSRDVHSNPCSAHLQFYNNRTTHCLHIASQTHIMYFESSTSTC